MTRSWPLLLPYSGVSPVFATPPIHAGPNAAVLGRATLGRAAWLGAGSVIRADGHFVEAGDSFHLGAKSTVHIAHGIYPTKIGANVTAGRNSVIHACEVGDDCHIGDDAVILDGSHVEAGCAIASGSIIFPRSELQSGWYYEGMPAKPIRRLESRELEALHAATRASGDIAAELPRDPADGAEAKALFVAWSATLHGRIVAAGGNGIWFGCDLDAGVHEIRIGENTNIQDNTTIRCIGRSVAIGRETTIGHNVSMTDCAVGDRSLVGISAVVAAGTIVGDDVLLAAGARTTEGQVLEDNAFYAGRPARRMAELDDRKRLIIAETWPTYCDYAARFNEAQLQSAARGGLKDA
jgi:carbonic anhydrase/acetyltransferase-like protein (isoleucine patch superfamily)